jgi:hypothetical protein
VIQTGLVILSEDCASRAKREAQPQSKDPVPAETGRPLRWEFYSPLLVLTIFLSSFAAAQTLTGTVKNSTTGKAAAGDDVVLLKLGQGMEEAGRTKTDAQGHFSFKLDDAQAPHLVRAIHQDVTYHRMAPPGTTSVELEVYDVGKKIDGIEVVADIMRIQAAQGQIEVIREFGVQNSSKPPRTQMNERNLEFNIPSGAQIIPDSATATTENGNPLKSAPVAEGEKGRYSFIFPLRPGLTRFEVAYQLPYSGNANIDPKSMYPLQHFVVMTPKSMQFAAAAAAAGFKLINYPNEPDAAVQVASNTAVGQNLAFKVSGEGTLEAPQEGGAQGSNEGAQGTANQSPGGAPSSGAQTSNRPGGGLGPPIDAPDPLQKYRWWILGGFAALLVIGGVYVASRQQSAARAMAGHAMAGHAMAGHAMAGQKIGSSPSSAMADEYEPAEILSTQPVRPAARPSSMLMEGIKEELFQLEVERKQGLISQAEYEKAKSALDQTLERALKREAQRA